LLRGRQRLDALAAADVVVYPSRDEIFGLVPLEALLCGTPVVVSNDSGCGEVIGRTGGGHMVPYGEAATLAGAIDDVLAHQAKWRARASKAAARARVLFGSAVVSQQMEELYREVLSQRTAGRLS
jgi:glycosyltransferase involved in cell wall biosynthesis